MTIKRLVLHVGVPTTGMSLIERSLQTLRPQLRPLGIVYVDRGQTRSLEHEIGLGSDAPGSAAGVEAFAEGLKAVVQSELDQGPGLPEIVLLSNDLMIGRADPEFGDPFWPRAAEGLGEVIRALSPRRTEVLVYVRRQDRMLESMYLRQLELGKAPTWGDFLANVGRDDRIRYLDLMDAIGGLPEVESIRVRPFEIIEGGAAPFVADFLSYFGAQDLMPSLTDFTAGDSYYTHPAREAALEINPHLRTDKQIRRTRDFLKRLFPPGEYRTAEPMTSEERSRVLEIYGPANLEFFREYLAEYPADSYLTEEATRRLGTGPADHDSAASE